MQSVTRFLPAQMTAICAIALVVGGCVSHPNPSDVTGKALSLSDSALISGVGLFETAVSSDEVPDEPMLNVDADMLAFLDTHVGDRGGPVVRFRRLFGSLIEEGHFEGTYDPYGTYTSAQTFHAQRGNCLSYTSMFVALARKAGIDAVFQVVHVPPTWRADAGFLIRSRHVNVVLRGVRSYEWTGSQLTLDFNVLEPDPKYRRDIVSDEFAESLFYANLAVEQIRHDRPRSAFAYLMKAFERAPQNPDLWINLGAFYSMYEHPELAVESFHRVLVIDPDNKAALSGLDRSHRALGQTAIADEYAARVESYRVNNPHYHFAVAQRAFERADYQAALDAIATALSMERNGRFYYLRGLAETALGDEAGARRSFRRAARFGHYRDLEWRYRHVLAAT